MTSQANHPRSENKSSRRGFLTLISSAAVALVGAAAAGLGIPYLRPRVTYGPPSRVPIGTPDLFASGTQVAFPEAKIVVRRLGNRVAAISTVCTHLGCTVNPSDTGFDCPCHGSTYDDRGSVTGGPAPEPLSWFRVTQTPSGELIVDKHEIVPAETFLELKA
jgi:cytochrome b6-f complex iron-sulfur subunit